MERLSANVSSAAVATGLTGMLNALLVILKDEIKSFKAAMASITGHHWTSQAVILLFVFAAVWIAGILLRLRVKPSTAWKWVLWGNIVGALVIMVYYIAML